MGLLGKDQPRTAGFEYCLGTGVEHLIAQTPFEHSDHTPCAGLRAMFASHSGRKDHFVETRRGFVGGGWRGRDGSTLR